MSGGGGVCRGVGSCVRVRKEVYSARWEERGGCWQCKWAGKVVEKFIAASLPDSDVVVERGVAWWSSQV